MISHDACTLKLFPKTQQTKTSTSLKIIIYTDCSGKVYVHNKYTYVCMTTRKHSLVHWYVHMCA